MGKSASTEHRPDGISRWWIIGLLIAASGVAILEILGAPCGAKGQLCFRIWGLASWASAVFPNTVGLMLLFAFDPGWVAAATLAADLLALWVLWKRLPARLSPGRAGVLLAGWALASAVTTWFSPQIALSLMKVHPSHAPASRTHRS